MKPGDLFRVKSTCDPRWMPQVYTLNLAEEFEYAFTLTYDDLGILIDPQGWGGYAKVMVRGQVVWVMLLNRNFRVIS